MKAVAILTAICLIGVIWLLIKGRRAAKKPLTLEELNFRVQYAMLTALNAENLKKSIDEMRERFIYDRKAFKYNSVEWLTIMCNLKRLESIERTFHFKFVEFVEGAKVLNPELKKIAELERTDIFEGIVGPREQQTPDLCCGIYESDRSENKRGFQNRSDVDSMDMEFMNTIH